MVESANSRIKQWKYLDHILPTNQIPHIGEFIRIICAISNRYCPPLNASKNSEEERQLAEKMLRSASVSNSLKYYVEANNLDRRNASWSSVSESDLNNFPQLTEFQLRAITLGTYQLRQGTSYIQEYLGQDCSIQLDKESDGLLRVRIQSRHVSARSYLVWIQYNDCEILGWYCRCRAGARTVGTCSHVAAVLWYLGLALRSDTKRGVQNWCEYLDDAGAPTLIDSSDSDSDVEE